MARKINVGRAVGGSKAFVLLLYVAVGSGPSKQSLMDFLIEVIDVGDFKEDLIMVVERCKEKYECLIE